MLFIGTITRLIEGDRYKHNHEHAPYPAAAGVSIPLRHARCSCRGDILCSAGTTQSRDLRVVAPVVAATPGLPHHEARRVWRYERRAMRDYHRAARHGYGYRQPIAIETIYGTGQSSYAPDYHEAGPSTFGALPERRRDDWEDDWLAARAAFGTSRIQKVQHEAPPPRYETVGRETDPRRKSVGVLTEAKGT